MNAKQDLPFEGTACSVVHSQCRKEGMAQESGRNRSDPGANRGICARVRSFKDCDENVVRRLSMRGHIKLFTLQMDPKRAEQFRVAAGIDTGRVREARPSLELVLQHGSQD